MKRISFICVLILLCSLPGQAQFWISFGWNDPHCSELSLDGTGHAVEWEAGSRLP